MEAVDSVPNRHGPAVAAVCGGDIGDTGALGQQLQDLRHGHVPQRPPDDTQEHTAPGGLIVEEVPRLPCAAGGVDHMVFSLVGLPVQLLLGIEPAQLLLGQVRDRNELVEIFQQRGFVRGGESRQRKRVHSLSGNTRRGKGLAVVV